MSERKVWIVASLGAGDEAPYDKIYGLFDEENLAFEAFMQTRKVIAADERIVLEWFVLNKLDI